MAEDEKIEETDKEEIVKENHEPTFEESIQEGEDILTEEMDW